MKTLLLTFLFCTSFFISANSQTVNDIPIEDIGVEYIQIIGTSRFLSDKVNIEIDFGQSTKFIGSNTEKKIKDEDGKKIKFNSMIDALNFMSQNGYEFIQAFALVEGNEKEYHYLLKKRVDKTEMK